jgi:hypothetical protein
MSATATKRKPDQTLAELHEEYCTIKAEAKSLYGRADVLLNKLAERLRKAGWEAHLNDHQKLVLRDTWKGQEKAYAGGFTRRYDVQVIDF